MNNPSAHKGVTLILFAALMVVATSRATATASPPPSIRLVVANQHVVLQRTGHRGARLDPGVFVAAVGGAVEFRVGRSDYDTQVGITQVNATDPSTVLRMLPDEVLDGWHGLKQFLKVEVKDPSGESVLDQLLTFCPNAYDRQRTTEVGPMASIYPPFCSANPFTKVMVWGIDDGWAANVFDSRAFVLRLLGPDGEYDVTVSINKRYVDLFEIPESQAVANIAVTLQTVDRRIRASRRLGAARGEVPAQDVQDVPTITDPNPEVLPDLVALPAWNLTVRNRQGRSRLNFASTEWNAGPQPLVVEGFRRPNSDVMEAYQYFYSNGQAVARAPVGKLEYDNRPGHQHWHFGQFASYSLLDTSGVTVARSKKASFCIAPTDAIDLSVPGADWAGPAASHSSVCGSSGAIWTRETMVAGWGDTYYQGLPGQSINITHLPNGVYIVRVAVNPLGRLFETNQTNDIELREIHLRGRPGHRLVLVQPWHDITA